jgi:hypothetical protein
MLMKFTKRKEKICLKNKVLNLGNCQKKQRITPLRNYTITQMINVIKKSLSIKYKRLLN